MDLKQRRSRFDETPATSTKSKNTQILKFFGTEFKYNQEFLLTFAPALATIFVFGGS